MLINALCKPSLGVPDYVTKRFQAENGQKLANFNRYISVITDIDQK